MRLRTRFFLCFSATVLVSVTLVAYGVTHYTRAALGEMDAQRIEALVAQFKKQFSRCGNEVGEQVENIAGAEITLRMALELARPNADRSLYVRDAFGAAHDQRLNFVEIVSWDGTVISSSQDPSRVGHKNNWILATKNWNDSPAFFKTEQFADGEDLTLTALRSVSVRSDRNLYIIGGRRIDKSFLSSLVLPSGMRALLYRNLDERQFVPADLTDANGAADQANRFGPLIDRVHNHPQPFVQTINWTSDPASAETFHVMPLLGHDKELLGVLLVGTSLRDSVLLMQRISRIAVRVAAAALLAGLLTGWWVSSRISLPG